MSGEPVQVAYFYRPAWGRHEEFVDLFERNHWPILRAQLEAGRFLDVRAYVPRFHGDGGAAWTLMVTITYRDWAALEDHSDPALVQRLYPDQERFKADEQRRFEILEAHWDVPLSERSLPR